MARPRKTTQSVLSLMLDAVINAETPDLRRELATLLKHHPAFSNRSTTAIVEGIASEAPKRGPGRPRKAIADSVDMAEEEAPKAKRGRPSTATLKRRENMAKARAAMAAKRAEAKAAAQVIPAKAAKKKKKTKTSARAA